MPWQEAVLVITPRGWHPVGRGQGSAQPPAVYKTASRHRWTWPQMSVASLLGSLVWSEVLWLLWDVFAFLLDFSLQGRLKLPGSHWLGLHAHAREGTSLFGPHHAPHADPPQRRLDRVQSPPPGSSTSGGTGGGVLEFSFLFGIVPLSRSPELPAWITGGQAWLSTPLPWLPAGPGTDHLAEIHSRLMC